MIPKINKILYTSDLSRNSAYAFRYAVNSAEKHDSKIDILYAVATSLFLCGEFDLLTGNLLVSVDTKAALDKKIRNRLDLIVQREFKDQPEIKDRVSSIQIVEGDPAVQILNKISELKSDLLIMGTHSKGVIAHTFLGSVATQVLNRVRIPVLIVPLPEKTDIDIED